MKVFIFSHVSNFIPVRNICANKLSKTISGINSKETMLGEINENGNRRETKMSEKRTDTSRERLKESEKDVGR